MNPPNLPFEGYKWRWATLTCTEGLNDPAVYLGVLRVMRQFEGSRPSDSRVLASLQEVENQTDTNVSLARSTRRNIIRNSGQYWKALNLMGDTRGEISLTGFGRRVADGMLSPVEFALITINTLELPNPRIEDVTPWGSLRIKPLQLILNILAELEHSHGEENAFITPFELARIVIPLAAERAQIIRYVTSIMMHREGLLDLSEWPNCVPESNDYRMAREFLLFLSNYGFCTKVDMGSRDTERYCLSNIEPDEIIGVLNVPVMSVDDVLENIRTTHLASSVERRRVMREVIDRPQQNQFRTDVLDAYNSTCLITTTRLPSVLEAAHILPVSAQGPDTIENSLCLRVDIHRMFDAGHLKIHPTGRLQLSETASIDSNYHFLPEIVSIPGFVSQRYIEWRWRYS